MKFTIPVVVLMLLCSSVSSSQSLALGVGIEDAIPMGSWSDYYGNGLGGSGSFEFGIVRLVNGYVRVGYLKFAQKQVQQDFFGGTYTYNASFWSFLAGAKIGFGGPYLALEMGYYSITNSATYNGQSYSAPAIGGFGIAPAAGYEFGLSKFMAIDLSAKYALVKDSNHLGIRAGVKFGL